MLALQAISCKADGSVLQDCGCLLRGIAIQYGFTACRIVVRGGAARWLYRKQRSH